MKDHTRSVKSRLGLLAGALSVALLIGLVAGGLAVGEAAILEVTPVGAEAFSEEIAPEVAAVTGVVKVERYLLIKTEPHDVIGVEPRAPLRIVTRDGTVIEATLEIGKPFRRKDDGKHVAIVGRRVYAEDYGGGMGAMAGMKHHLGVGQTFKLIGEAGPRVRVLGWFSARPEREAEKVFLPLATAQRLFNREGQVSHLFLVVKGDPAAVSNEIQSALGAGVQVRVLSR